MPTYNKKSLPMRNNQSIPKTQLQEDINFTPVKKYLNINEINKILDSSTLQDKAISVNNLLTKYKEEQNTTMMILTDVNKNQKKLSEVLNMDEYEKNSLNSLNMREKELRTRMENYKNKITALDSYLKSILIKLNVLENESTTKIGQSISMFPSVPRTTIQKSKTKAKGKDKRKKRTKRKKYEKRNKKHTKTK